MGVKDLYTPGLYTHCSYFGQNGVVFVYVTTICHGNFTIFVGGTWVGQGPFVDTIYFGNGVGVAIHGHFTQRNVCSVITGVFTLNNMGVGVSRGTHRTPRVLTFRPTTHTPTMGLGTSGV